MVLEEILANYNKMQPKDLENITTQVSADLSEFPTATDNIFDFLWQTGGWVEKLHEGIVAWLLDSQLNHELPFILGPPWINHGFGVQFLEDFLSCAGIQEPEEIVWSHVDRNIDVNNFKLDLVVRYETRSKLIKTLVIECKKGKKSPFPQLKQYKEACKSWPGFENFQFIGLTLNQTVFFHSGYYNVSFDEFAPKVKARLGAQPDNQFLTIIDSWARDMIEKSGPLRWAYGQISIPNERLEQIGNAITKIAGLMRLDEVTSGQVVLYHKGRDWNWNIFIEPVCIAPIEIEGFHFQVQFGLEYYTPNFYAKFIEGKLWVRLPRESPVELKKKYFALFLKGMEQEAPHLKLLVEPKIREQPMESPYTIEIRLVCIRIPFTREKVIKGLILLLNLMQFLNGECGKVLDYVKTHWTSG